LLSVQDNADWIQCTMALLGNAAWSRTWLAVVKPFSSSSDVG